MNWQFANRAFAAVGRQIAGLDGEAYEHERHLERSRWERLEDLEFRRKKVRKGEMQVKNEEVDFMHLPRSPLSWIKKRKV